MTSRVNLAPTLIAVAQVRDCKCLTSFVALSRGIGTSGNLGQ